MRTLGIELGAPVVEAVLLRSHVRGWRPSRICLQRAMHALMAPVLIGLSGLDALVPDAKFNPPHREPRKAAERLRGERHAIVGADGLWQPTALEELLKDWNGAALLPRRQGLHIQHEARVGVADRKRIAVDATRAS